MPKKNVFADRVIRILNNSLTTTIETENRVCEEKTRLRRALLLSHLLSSKWVAVEGTFGRENAWTVCLKKDVVPVTELRKHETFAYDEKKHEQTAKTSVFVWTRDISDRGIAYVCSDTPSKAAVKELLQKELEKLL